MLKKFFVISLLIPVVMCFLVPLGEAQYEDYPELISLDLKGMEIRDVLKILSQKSGLNIVADKDVKGEVSLYLKDVDVVTILDVIVSTNGLAYEEQGSLIKIMSDKKYERIYGKRFTDKTKTEIIKLNHAKASAVGEFIKQMNTKAGNVIVDDRSNTLVLIDDTDTIKLMKQSIAEMDVPLTTEVFPLDYANAEAIKDNLEKVVSAHGSVKFDERTNKVIVTDSPATLETVQKIVTAFDEKTKEVIIDANIIQVTLSDKYSYGVDWAAIAALGDVRLTADGNISTGLTGVNPSSLTMATTGGNYSAVLNLLKTFGETNVLSRPRVTVANQEKAKILVGAKEPYVTSQVTTTTGGTYHTTDNVQFVDVGVSLMVTPEINRAGYVTLKVKPEVSTSDATKTVELKNPDGSTRTIVPYVTTSEAETTVVIKDNTTLIIGGLMKDTLVEHDDRIPFFSDIPVLGKLFSAKGSSKEKTELVVFITPHIIEGDTTTKDAKFYLKDWENKKGNINIERPNTKYQTPNIKPQTSKQIRNTKAQTPNTKLQTSKQIRNTKPQTPNTKLQTSKPKPAASAGKTHKPKQNFNITKTPYESYYLMIRKEINQISARQNVSGAKGEVQVQFTLDKKGFLTRGPVVLNKPDLTLVRAAVNCIKKASPFPPFPKGLKQNDAQFAVTVRYE